MLSDQKLKNCIKKITKLKLKLIKNNFTVYMISGGDKIFQKIKIKN